MSSRSEQDQVVYEEEEVLWAKIRGYPWWPAFVDKVHQPTRGKQSEYTVFFFGDNTQYPSSKLGASKLRKFYEFYTEFYQKARAHRKLMASIQLAEEKLRQNDQNVEIFEQLRTNMKVIKKPKGTSLQRKQSKMSEPEPQISEGKEELPDLSNQFNQQGKSKTFAHGRNRRISSHQEEVIVAEPASPEQEESSVKVQPIKKQERNNSTDKKTVKQKPKKEDPSPSTKKKRNPREDIFEQESTPREDMKEQVPKKQQPVMKEQKEQQEEVQQIEVEVEAEAEEEESQVQAEESIQQQQPRSQESEDPGYSNKLRNNKRRIEIQRRQAGPRKRGRPKKRSLRQHVHEQRDTYSRTHNNHRISHIKRKIIHKAKTSPKKMQVVSILSDEDNEIIENIKNLLNNRQELVEYLCSISISINNVKEILELGVSNILQEGDKNQRINDLLIILRHVLLYKYFPEDVKHKKKYQKILKRKPITVKSEEKQKQQIPMQIRQDQQIRKKTIVKLEKFLKNYPQVQNKAKQFAIKIEGYFQKVDSSIGDKYKTTAFEILSSLKDKKENINQIMQRLEENAYD